MPGQIRMRSESLVTMMSRIVLSWIRSTKPYTEVAMVWTAETGGEQMSDKLKLLTFIGPKPYEEVEYTFRGTPFKTEFFAEALSHWHTPARTFFFLTPKAKGGANWKKLRNGFPASWVPISRMEKAKRTSGRYSRR